MPGPHAGTEPDIDEVRDGLERTRHLRIALDLLEETLPRSRRSGCARTTAAAVSAGPCSAGPT
jgi:hypothetical protein